MAPRGGWLTKTVHTCASVPDTSLFPAFARPWITHCHANQAHSHDNIKRARLCSDCSCITSCFVIIRAHSGCAPHKLARCVLSAIAVLVAKQHTTVNCTHLQLAMGLRCDFIRHFRWTRPARA